MDAIRSTAYLKKIRNNSLFSDINDESLLELLAIANPCDWPERTCILQTDQELRKFYIITIGVVKAYDYDSKNDRELILSLLTENDALNVCSLISEGSTSLYYETLTPTEVLYIPLNKMQEWTSKNPLFFKQILAYVLKKMEHLEDIVSDICLKDTSTRLAKLLLHYTNKSTNKIETIDGFTHNQLAGLIGTTRAVLNRHLQEFKEEGILDIKRKHLEIIDYPLLHKKASPLNM
ncbi:Crp/Fnr family transcriptional regulator [Arenibacter latericius]|uniref:Crp/Fnr family transcriptional regulator n=1 Tax=Arenibacter latericius TaxID=86104 RepID=UPI00040791FC|nr:Crp/Fnr family transcriptional regulator [Arenibacter latericius]MDX1363226.1 Crp/Fnr family transcriptional regulator [Arenibacter latericius]